MEEEILEEEIQVQEENYIKADLSDYYTKEETDTLLDEKADISDIPDISGKQDLITSSNKLESDLVSDNLQNNLFVTGTEKTTWNSKQDALTFDSTPTLNSNNPVTSNGIKEALDNIPSTAIYLGKATDFNAQEKAIDLDELPIGCYCIYPDVTYRTYIYIKAKYGTTTLTNSFYTYLTTSKLSTGMVYLIKYSEIPEEPTGTIYFGEICYTSFTDNYNIYVSSNPIKISSYALTIDYVSKTLNLCSTDTAQTISQKKTFNVLPESSVTPTTSNQLVNKQYVDDIVGNINTILATLTTVNGGN